MAKIKNVWMVSRELGGVAGAGGLKDVTQQLLMELVRSGVKATLVMPFYNQIKGGKFYIEYTGIQMALPMDGEYGRRNERVWIHRMELWGATIYLIDAIRYAEKDGIYNYTAAEAERFGNPDLRGRGYPDANEMNIILQKAALELIMILGERPDVIHVHDAHTALVPPMMRTIPRYRYYFDKIGVGLTIHNAGSAYHQLIAHPGYVSAVTEISWEAIMRCIYWNHLDPFRVGSLYADFVNTVSPQYARNIMAEGRAGVMDGPNGGLGYFYNEVGIELQGVTNGIDPAEYDPTNPQAMGTAAAFDPARGDMAGKAECRSALITEVNTRATAGVDYYGYIENIAGRPLITSISRLTGQKGIDILLGAARRLLEQDSEVAVLVLGSGEKFFEDQLISLASNPLFAGRIVAAIGYNPGLAHRIYAGGDFFVNAAYTEPCGLTDFMAQLMGNVPIVHWVDGLEKVIDGETGYTYIDQNPDELTGNIHRAIAVFRDEPQQHLKIIQNAIKLIRREYTWEKVLKKGYMPLYEAAKAARG